MTQNQSIIYNQLHALGYSVETVFYESRIKNPFGWFAVFENEQTYYLGRTLESSIYNINNRQIKALQN